MFAFIARIVVGHPWRVIAGWLVVAVAIIVFSPDLEDHTSGNNQDFLPTSFESIQAQDLGNEYFPATSGATGTLVVSRTDGAAMSPTDQQAAIGLATTLQNEKIPGVTAVTGSQQSFSPDGKVAALQVAFAGQPGDDIVNDAVPLVRTDATAALEGTDLQAGLTGNAAILVDSNSAYDDAENVITIATVIIILLTLGLVFRSPIIAVLPIVVIGVVFTAVRGVTAFAAELFDFEVSTSLDAILVVVLFGVGTDYIVFLLFRYREELRQGDTGNHALILSTRVVGRVVASSALTVIGAFSALFLAKLGSLNSLAPGLIIGVALMLVTALTLIPAVCAVLGKHLFWPLGPGPEPKRSPFGPISRFVGHRPVVVVITIAAGLIVLAIFSTGYKSTYDTLDEMPSDTPSQEAFSTLSASLPPGALSPTQVYIKTPGPVPQDELATLSTNLSQVPGVASVTPPKLSQDGTAALINVILVEGPYTSEALDAVEGPIRDTAHSSMPDAEVLVGGQTSTLVDVRSQLNTDTSRVFPVAVVIVGVILGLLLLSVLAPINLLVCVGLTFAATLGALVIVFLHGAGYDGIDFSTPIVLYLFVVAIGTDYNILLAERLREEFKNGHSPAEAARIAISNDGPTVSASGTILALTFASLTLTGLENLQELGAGVAIGVLLASLVMAPMLVPGLSVLQRSGFWWPANKTKPPAADTDARVTSAT
jgi:putative drug exporter of the RND superfamily